MLVGVNSGGYSAFSIAVFDLCCERWPADAATAGCRPAGVVDSRSTDDRFVMQCG